MHSPQNPAAAGATKHSKQRLDIQVLRAFAVLLVLFYHAKFEFFTAGYLGVDIFFVVSGFLITRLVKDGIESNTFSFQDFYIRRARRLLPAAFVTFFVVTLLAPFFLANGEMQDFRGQLIGAVTFVSNIVLWRQSGYFDGVSDLKPLLHIWSLAIEEQYYFLLPAALFFTPRKLWKPLGLFVLVSSFALCMVVVQSKPGAAFFLLPTRLWELGIGSAGAMMVFGPRATALVRVLFLPAIALLMTLPFVKLTAIHPGPDALLICLATLVVLVRNHSNFFVGYAAKAMGKIGDISYSLYLVHWPLFAFLNNMWIGGEGKSALPLSSRLVTVTLSFFLAWLLHRYVEVRFRHVKAQRAKGMFGQVLLISAALISLNAGMAYALSPAKNFAEIRRPNMGMNSACNFGDKFESLSVCRTSDQPTTMVWGDSFGMHLIPGLIAMQETKPSILQATRSACGPLLGIAQSSEKYSRDWGDSCIRFNDSVVDYLKNAQSINMVVLSSPFNYYLTPGGQVLEAGSTTGDKRVVPTGLAVAMSGLEKTIHAIRAMGKRVVVVAPPPSSGFDVGRCLDRQHNHQISLGANPQCEIRVTDWHTNQAHVEEFLKNIQSKLDVEVIKMSDYLCDTKTCKTQIGKVTVYRDSEHLSVEGSTLIARAIDLPKKIHNLAK